MKSIAYVFVLMWSLSTAFADSGPWTPKLGEGQLRSCHEVAQFYKKKVPEEFRGAIFSALKDYKANNVGPAKGKLVESIEKAVCAASGDKAADFQPPKVQFPINPKDDPRVMMLKTLANSNPNAVRKMAADSIRQSKDRFLTNILHQWALEKFDRKFGQPTKAQFTKRVYKSREQTQNDYAALSGGFDTPQDKRAAEKRASTTYHDEFDQKAYDEAVAKWKAEAPARQKSRERIFAMSRETLLKDPDLSKKWETFKRNSHLSKISDGYETMARACDQSTRASIDFLAKDPVKKFFDSHAEIWLDFRREQAGKDYAPENELEEQAQRRSNNHADLLAQIAGELARQAGSGSILGSVEAGNLGVRSTRYTAQRYYDVGGEKLTLSDMIEGYGIDENDRIQANKWWTAGAGIAAAAATIASLGTLGPEAFAGFASVAGAANITALGLGGAQMYHALSETRGSNLIEKFSNNKLLFLDALLFALPMSSAALKPLLMGKTLREMPLFKAAMQQFKNATKAEEFVKQVSRVSAVLNDTKNGYFTFQAINSVSMATQACATGDTATCVSQLGLALLQALPQGVDTYRVMRKGCAYYRPKEEPARQLAEEDGQTSGAETPEGAGVKTASSGGGKTTRGSAPDAVYTPDGVGFKAKLGNNPAIKFTVAQTNKLAAVLKGATTAQIEKVKNWFKSIRAKSKSDDEAAQAVMKKVNNCQLAYALNAHPLEPVQTEFEIEGEWYVYTHRASSTVIQ